MHYKNALCLDLNGIIRSFDLNAQQAADILLKMAGLKYWVGKLRGGVLE